MYVFCVDTSEHEVGSGKRISSLQGDFHLWHISLTAVKSNSTGDHLYFWCHSNGLVKLAPLHLVGKTKTVLKRYNHG